MLNFYFVFVILSCETRVSSDFIILLESLLSFYKKKKMTIEGGKVWSLLLKYAVLYRCNIFESFYLRKKHPKFQDHIWACSFVLSLCDFQQCQMLLFFYYYFFSLIELFIYFLILIETQTFITDIHHVTEEKSWEIWQEGAVAFAFAFLVTRWAWTLPVRAGRLWGTVALRKVQKLFCCKGNIPREPNLWSILPRLTECCLAHNSKSCSTRSMRSNILFPESSKSSPGTRGHTLSVSQSTLTTMHALPLVSMPSLITGLINCYNFWPLKRLHSLHSKNSIDLFFIYFNILVAIQLFF